MGDMVAVMDRIFGSDNALDIPSLDDRWQADGLDPPLMAWGTARRGRRMPGTWHHYVDDYRFARLWDRPDLLLETGALGAVEVNYSVFDATPLAVAIGMTYRKRWLARYWQSHGVKIWVDLNVARQYRELNLCGVPRSWTAYATRGYETHPDAVLEEWEHVASWAQSARLLVYGGGPAVRATCERIGALHIPDQQSEIRDRTRRVIAGQWRGRSDEG